MKVLILQHEGCAHPGLLNAHLREAGMEQTTVKLYHHEPIPDPGDYDALVVLGGSMGVYQEREYPFLVEEDKAIKRALEKGVPILSMGLGGQLLAKALGAPVTRNFTREIGFYSVSLAEAGARDKLFSGCGRWLTIFQWHGDTFAIPQGAVKLASSSTCENQAFRYGPNAYALQFHLQVTPAMIATWAEEYRVELAAMGGGANVPLMVQEAYRRDEAMREQSRQLFSNFFTSVASQAAPAR